MYLDKCTLSGIVSKMSLFRVHGGLLFLLSLLFLSGTLPGCRRSAHPVSKSLVSIDSLLVNNPSSAYDSLCGIKTDLMSEQDRVYHDLLLTIAQHKNNIPFQQDSIISSVCTWYKKGTDWHNQARSLFYYGLVQNAVSGNQEKALEAMQEARRIIEEKKIEDDRLKALLYAYLGKINSKANNSSEAVSFFRKAVSAEKRLGNPRNLILDYSDLLINLVMAGELEEASSVLGDLDKLRATNPVIRLRGPENAKAIYYLYGKENLDSAYFYCVKSDIPNIDKGAQQKQLASIYRKKQMPDSALVYERLAYSNRSVSDSILHHIYFRNLSDLFSQLGNADSAAIYARMAYQSLYDNTEQKVEKRILELEKQYDMASKDAQIQQIKMSRQIGYLTIALLLLALAFVLYLLFIRRKQLLAKQRQVELTQLLANQQQQALDMQQIRLKKEMLVKRFCLASAKNHQNTLSLLEKLKGKTSTRSVDSLQREISQITLTLRTGFNTNYNEALNESQELLSPEQRTKIDQISGGRSKIVWLLKDLGFSIEEIAIYTCTSPESVRTLLHKSNKKLISQY